MQNAAVIEGGITPLLELARDDSTESRRTLFVAIANLFERNELAENTSEHSLLRQIMRRLINVVETDVRIALARRLAQRDDAPHALIALLANDKIDVAGLVLARSSVLTEQDLIDIVRTATTLHQRLVAARPDVTERLSEALAESTDNAVIQILLRNANAKIAHATLDVIALRLDDNEVLQEALLTRPGLPKEIAARLYGEVADSLKAFIVQHFDVDAESLSADLAESAAPPDGAASAHAKLIAKLAHGGDLTAGFLLRSLKQGQIDLFEAGLAARLNIAPDKVRDLIYSRGAYFLALICRALGIDRSVFMTVFQHTRMHANLPLLLSADEKAKCDHVFSSLSTDAALTKVQAVVG